MMEYTEFKSAVDDIRTAQLDVDEAYADLMAREENTLRVIERVADDARRESIQASDILSMSLASVAKAAVDFWSDVYVHLMRQDTALAMQLLRSSNGLIQVGIVTILAVITLLILT
jgi:hypothetical protein